MQDLVKQYPSKLPLLTSGGANFLLTNFERIIAHAANNGFCASAA